MIVADNSRQGTTGLKAFFAFALLALSLSNNYYWSLWFPTPDISGIDDSTGAPPIKEETIAAVKEETIASSPSPAPTKPILFLHFHKSGGTGACSAMKQFLTVSDASGTPITKLTRAQRDLIGNCNTPFSGPNADVKLFAPLQTCRHLLPYALDAEYKPRNNVIAIEVPFQDEMPCKEGNLYRTFAIMRNPVTRLLSHMLAHRGWTERQILSYISRKKPAPDNYYLDGYPIVNNFVIRQLLGRERYIDVVRPIDDDDLERAKRIVDEFDAFVPMEYLDHVNVQALLNATVPEFQKGHHKKSSSKQPRKSNSYSPSEIFLKRITKENKYDILLYQYMLEKLGIEEAGNKEAV